MALKIKTLTGLVNAALHIKTSGGIVPVALHAKTADGIAAISGRVQPLRYASPMNQVPNYVWDLSGTYGGVTSNFAYRAYRPIGSGDCTALRVICRNWAMAQGGVQDTGGALTITDAYLESVSPAMSVRLTFGGANGTVISAGGSIVTDPLRPDAFGLAKFLRGSEMYIRVRGTFDGLKICSVYSQQSGGFSSGNGGALCNNIGSTGALTYTGTTKFLGNGMCFDLLGTFTTDPIVVGGLGDSIFAGVGDTFDAGSLGLGYFTRALVGSNIATDGIAGCNFGISGGYLQTIATLPAQISAEINYANTWISNYGTNNFDQTANYNESQFNFVFGYATSGWSNIRAAYTAQSGRALKLAHAHLLPRTNAPTDSTSSGQVIFGPKWDIGGNVDSFNARVDANVGTLLDARFDTSSARLDPSSTATTNYHKWVSGNLSSSDGTHPLRAQVAPLSSGLRALIVQMQS